jgi:hypothetical protein
MGFRGPLKPLILSPAKESFIEPVVKQSQAFQPYMRILQFLCTVTTFSRMWNVYGWG